MDTFNLDEFKIHLKDITTSIVETISNSEKKANKVCGFSLYTDEDASSISASYNTKSYLKSSIKEDPDEDSEYYKWYPAEWKNDFVENEQLDAFSRLLFEVSTSDEVAESNISPSFSNQIYSKIIEVLKELKEENTFNQFSEDLILCFYISDYENLEEELFWVKELNNDKEYSEFEKWRIKIEEEDDDDDFDDDDDDDDDWGAHLDDDEDDN